MSGRSTTLAMVAMVAVLSGSHGCYSGVNHEAGGVADGGDTDRPADEGSAGEEGSTGGGADDGGGDGPTPGDAGIPQCDPSLVPDATALRRLSRAQYENTVRDLLTWAAPTEAEAIVLGLAPSLDMMPADERTPPAGDERGGFRRMDQAVQQQHVDAGYQVARALAIAVTNDAAPLTEVAGSCATDGDPGNDATCVDTFIRRFGERAHRRPLTEEEVTEYHAVFDADGVTQGIGVDAFADVIVSMLMAPQFLYMVEHGDEPVPELPGVYRLSAFELAARLSYHFWQTMPDDALFEAARSGALLTEEEYRRQVDRMMAAPQARIAVGEFYAEWMWTDEVAPVSAQLGEPAFDAFVGSTPIGEDTSQNMADELVAMATHYTFDTAGSLRDLMLSDRSFATTPDLAEIYGVPVWDGGEPPIFPNEERAGLLTRAAVLANSTTSTRPILRGVFVAKALLCGVLPPPPANAETSLPAFDGEMTTREVVEELNEQPGTSCAACHQTIINPLGFATESFDALGRFRTRESVYAEDGALLASLPIETTVAPYFAQGGEQAANARELAQMILDSGDLHGCFARHYLRFTFARAEDPTTDACTLMEIVEALGADAPLSEALRAIAMTDQFRQRSFD